MRTLRAAALLSIVLGIAGCELVADFDRSLLDPERPDASFNPPLVPDDDGGTHDASHPDSQAPEEDAGQ